MLYCIQTLSCKKMYRKALLLAQSAWKRIALKVTSRPPGNGIKYSRSLEFVPPRIKLTFVICRPSNISQTFTLFSLHIKNVPCRHRAASLRGKRSKQFIFDMCVLIALSSPWAPPLAHATNFTRIQTHVLRCIRSSTFLSRRRRDVLR